VGHIRPPASIAQINPPAGSGFSSYTDIIRLDKTGIMGLSSTLGLAKTLPEILHEIVGLNPIIFGCKCGCVRISIAGKKRNVNYLRVKSSR